MRNSFCEATASSSGITGTAGIVFPFNSKYNSWLSKKNDTLSVVSTVVG